MNRAYFPIRRFHITRQNNEEKFKLSKLYEEKLRNIRGTKDVERRQEMIQKEILKLTNRGQTTKQDKVIKDAVMKNEWKLRERVREFEEFEDQELLQIALDKDEVSRQINDVMIDQERKYEIRVQKAKEALNLLQEIAPELVPKPSVESFGIEFSGPNYSLPIDEYFTMKAPLGTANRFE